MYLHNNESIQSELKHERNEFKAILLLFFHKTIVNYKQIFSYRFIFISFLSIFKIKYPMPLFLTA